MSNIFSENAEQYWQRGLSVIPLYKREKRPIPNGWSQWHDHLPSEEQRSEWLHSFPDANIGLVLGKQSNVVAFDIDTIDPVITKKLVDLLPVSPWKRVGKKGMVLAYRWSGLKTFRVKSAAGESICEMLSDKTQVVLPPSIHPETKMPYEANCPLYEVLSILPELPQDIEEKIRKLLTDNGVELSHSGWTKVTEFVSSGSRDTNMTEKAGLFAYAIMRGERTLKEAMGMLESYNEEFVQNVAGDSMDIEKHKRNMILFLHRDVTTKGRILPEGWDAGLSAEDKKNWGVEFTKDHEEWTVPQIKEHLYNVFEKDKASGGPDSMMAIDQMLVKIANSQNLKGLEVEQILTYIAKNSGTGIRVPSLMRQIKAIRTEGGGVQGINQTELARALMEDLNTLYPVRYHAESFWKWAGGHWEVMPEQWLIFKISDNYGHTAAAKKHSDMIGVMKLFKAIVPQGLTDKPRTSAGVNFANGYLTQDLDLIPHSPELGMTYTLPFRYLGDKLGENVDLSHHAPMFWRFLVQSWGDDPDFMEKVSFLQEMLAATLFGMGSHFQRVFLLHGVPKSGKSQMLKIASSLVPDTARSAVSPNEWADKFMPTEMFGKLLNVAGELHERKMIDGQRFKDIVDGSEITGQHKFGHPFRMVITCTHWFASNHFPRTEDSSDGFNRRWGVLNFCRPVPASEMISGLGDLIVAQEREIIVAWAVTALKRLIANHDYSLPESHHMIVGEMATMNNPVRGFLKDTGKFIVTRKSEDRITEDKMYNKFWEYCVAVAQKRPMPIVEFRSKIRELMTVEGFKVERLPEKKMGVEQWVYIGIKETDIR